MSGGYGDLPRLAGTAYLPVTWLARVPAAMITVGVLSLVAATRGSYAEGGIASGFVGAGTALAAPAIGSITDRWGQRIPMQAVGVLNAFMYAAVALAALSHAPLWIICVAAFAAGVTNPQVGVLSRGRWMALTRPEARPEWSAARRARTLSAALGFESMADELSFVVGPALVSVLALGLGLGAPLLIAAGAALVFVTYLAQHRTARSRPLGGAEDSREPLTALCLIPVAGTFALGTFFGSALQAATAFAGARGDESAGGLYYGAMGVTSALLALGVAVLPASIPLARRWSAIGLVLFAGSFLLPAVSTPVPLVLALLVLGAGIGPAMVTMFAVSAKTAPQGRSGLVMTLMSSGTVVGQALASPIAGAAADHGSFPAAAWCVVASAGLVAVVSCAGAALLHRRSAES